MGAIATSVRPRPIRHYFQFQLPAAYGVFEARHGQVLIVKRIDIVGLGLGQGLLGVEQIEDRRRPQVVLLLRQIKVFLC